MKASQNIPFIKLSIAFIACITIRLLPPPFRAPNVEPLMATVMPFAKHSGALVGFVFAALSMAIFDVISGHLGLWTIGTALAYGLVGAGAPAFFKYFSGVRGYVSYAVVATLAFDFLTGVIMGPALFGQSFMAALVGQIPFTFMHLAGNMAFALTISPLIETWILSAKPAPTPFVSEVALNS